MKKLLVVLLIFSSLVLGGLAAPRTVSAAVAPECDGSSWFLGFPTWYRYLDVTYDSATDSCSVELSEDGWVSAASRIGLAVIEILLRIGTLVSVGFVIYGGFRYITSQGEPENTKSARQTIINSLIGLVVTLIATGVVAFIANQLTK